MNRLDISFWPPKGALTSLALAGFGLVIGCSRDESLAGKGVITETTNGAAARGRLVTADSVPVTSGVVRAVIDQDVPEAWNGMARATATVGPDGRFTATGLDKPKFILYADCKDSRGRALGAITSLTIPQENPNAPLLLPDLVVTASARLAGRFAPYDSVWRSLPSGSRLRVTVRGLGWWTYLDSAAWSFENLPAGDYRVRVQTVDGIPGHETTLWEATVTAR